MALYTWPCTARDFRIVCMAVWRSRLSAVIPQLSMWFVASLAVIGFVDCPLVVCVGRSFVSVIVDGSRLRLPMLVAGMFAACLQNNAAICLGLTLGWDADPAADVGARPLLRSCGTDCVSIYFARGTLALLRTDICFARGTSMSVIHVFPLEFRP